MLWVCLSCVKQGPSCDQAQTFDSAMGLRSAVDLSLSYHTSISSSPECNSVSEVQEQGGEKG